MTLTKNNFNKISFPVPHRWVTVVNPYNQVSLLEACDDCGVVKSENSVIKRCLANKGTGLISNAMEATVQIAV